MSGLIPHLAISQSHMFLLNSRLGLFTAASYIAVRKRPFSRSYRAILPSSLAMIHSSTLGSSPRPPVSVCGTGFQYLELSGFSRKSDYLHYLRSRSFAVLSGFSRVRGFAYGPYTYALQRTIPSVRGSVTTPSPHRNIEKYGNIDPLSIGCLHSDAP